ncbi:unnamed protein product [Psylliodes chrysocephalus]|uniref:Enkurin domain-containing protein n=1 Tax=Psylliodes chrysocephalus TaxID=3402493 RepID=A0A9P0D7Y0_9CUCU|nr:unnamed protein product [Psylliodes chrysocephala]
MSIILMTHHDENIYDIFKSQTEAKKQIKLRYKTEKDQVKVHRPEVIVPKKKYAIMGVANLELPDPHNFLKKGSGEPCYVKVTGPKERSKCCLAHKRDEVPKTKEVVKLYNPPKEDKDFVVHNINKIKDQPAKEPEPYLVLDKFGNKEPISVLEPLYVKMKPYGKTPAYLKKFMRQKEKEYQLKKDTIGASQPICRYVTRHRRKELLNGLKQNWEELQLQYQAQSIYTDTLPKILRKSKIENQLKQLERDIVLLERHPYIYVYEDNEIP